MEFTITKEDLAIATSYDDNHNCYLATAFKRQFGDKYPEIHVGTSTIHKGKTIPYDSLHRNLPNCIATITPGFHPSDSKKLVEEGIEFKTEITFK